MVHERSVRRGLVLLFFATASVPLAPDSARAQLATAGAAIGAATGGLTGALTGAALGSAVGGISSAGDVVDLATQQKSIKKGRELGAIAGGAIGLATGGVGGALSGAAIGTAVGGVGGRIIGSAEPSVDETAPESVEESVGEFKREGENA
jgi:hypothetical protein